MTATAPAGWAEAERAARSAYGRLVAWLAWQWRDLAAAEDALSEAFVSALTHWPRDGVPSNPDAWLLTTAKRQLLQHARHQRLVQSPEVQAVFESDPTAPEPDTIPDRRLALMCTCAHPALATALHAPLMLQAVLGLEAKTIARAFLVTPSAMAQRLVRAKAKIRDAGMRFEVPQAEALQGRLAAVLDGIYAAYTIGSDLACPAPEAEPALREEAVFLARLVAQLQVADASAQAEALGLLALLLHTEARRPAQLHASDFIPLGRQDTALWRRDQMQEAEAMLWRAASLRAPGPFQLEAAIQSAHNQRAFSGHTPWPQIAQLYALLVQHHPGIGAQLGQAVALAETGELAPALALLAAMPAGTVAAHQPYWVTRAHLLQLSGLTREADAARQRAAGLTADARVRRFLLASPR